MEDYMNYMDELQYETNKALLLQLQHSILDPNPEVFRELIQQYKKELWDDVRGIQSTSRQD